MRTEGMARVVQMCFVQSLLWKGLLILHVHTFHILFFIIFERLTDRAPFCSFIPQMIRSLVLNLFLPCRWQAPNYLSITCCLPESPLGKSWNCESDLGIGLKPSDTGHGRFNQRLNHQANAHPRYLIFSIPPHLFQLYILPERQKNKSE